MQQISDHLTSAIEATTMRPAIRVIGEWNHNLYIEEIEAGNLASSTEYDEELFPIESIFDSPRPTKSGGISKLFTDKGFIRHRNNIANAFRIASDKDKFKYWVSNSVSSSSSPFNISSVEPYIKYTQSVWCNFIAICFESSWSNPTSVDVWTTPDGSLWQSIGTNFIPDSNGRLYLYRQNNNSWSKSFNETGTPLSIRGVRIRVNRMNRPASRVHLIELSPRLIQDLSGYVEEASIEQNRENIEIDTPVGTSGANMFNASLDNTDNTFSPENSNSLFFRKIDANVKFDVSVGYDTSDHGGSGIEYINLGKYYADEWDIDSSDATVSVSCRDYTKFLQDVKVPKVFYENVAPEIIFRDILLRSGFNNFIVRRPASYTSRPVSYLWYNDDTSLWAALIKLARSEQAVIYIDENDNIVYEVRTQIYNNLSAVYELRSNTNIIDLSTDFNLYANDVTIRYAEPKPNEFAGEQANQILWQPSDDTSIMSSPLNGSMTPLSTVIPLSSDELQFWRDEGFVNIEGEYMSFKDKTSNGLVVDKRGLFGSPIRPHFSSLTGWNTLRTPSHSSGTVNNISEQGENLGKKRMRLTSSSTPRDRWLISHRGGGSDSHIIYGTQLEFSRPTAQDTTSWHTMAGMVINMQSNGAGYYFELITDGYAGVREQIGMVRMYKMDGNQNRQGLPNTSQGRYGYDFLITAHRPYTLEVIRDGNTYTLFLDGTLVASFNDSQYSGGRWGTYVRGRTQADFNYFYHMDPTGIDAADVMELYRLHDRIHGGWISSFFHNVRLHQSGLNWFFDEFGAPVHELREFNAEYTMYPALNADVVSSNTWQSRIFSHEWSPFNSRFMIENTARVPAVVQGESFSIIHGENVSNHLLISGVPIVREEEEKIEKQNEGLIRRYGKVELDIQNEWIQNEQMANDLGDFIMDRWSQPMDIINAETLATPALQVGDVVRIRYPEKHMTSNSFRYHLIERSIEYNNGITSRLRLRRVR